MPVPNSPVLRAAARWLEHRRDSSDAQLRALFSAHPSYADLTPTQYASAYEWLQSKGLLDTPIRAEECSHAIFEAAIRETLWFPDADLLVPESDSMPDDGLHAAEALSLEPFEAFATLRRCWGKVDTAERTRIGTAGELALLSLLKSVESVEVRHLAEESDGYGYDIHVSLPDSMLHIEVKATTRRGRLSIFLSRHEFETMRCDPNWALVAVRMNDSLEPIATATVDKDWLAAAVPMDQPGGRWESVKIEVPQRALAAGVVAISSYNGDESPILRGLPAWPGP